VIAGGAAGIAARVASGAITARAVAEQALAAADDAAALNLFTDLDPDLVLQRAEAVDRRLAGGEAPGPLAGVPVVLKDVIDQAGRPTTAGSSFLRSFPEASAPVVERLEAAGAVILGRTGLHEFAFGFSSENPWWGPVRNPWDPATSPGGSSGGSAAAVAAGVAPLGIGTDTGGSVRVPASLCGLVGLKVGHGRVPLRGVFPLAASLDTVGPLAATVEDAALAYTVTAGFDPDDPWSAPRPAERPEGPSPLRDLRVLVPLPWSDRPLDPGVSAGFEAALELIEEEGAVVDRAELPWLVPSRHMAIGLGAEVAAVHRRWFAEDPERYGADVARRLERSLAVTTDELTAALRWRAGVRNRIAELFRRVDVVVTPTTAVHRKTIGIDEVETEAGPEPFRRALSWFTSPVNHLGVPALALPIAAACAPPPSLQLIGPTWSESRLPEIGMALEVTGAVAAAVPGPPAGGGV